MANEYVEEVLSKLSDNPTSQDLDYLLEAHARIGYLAAIARGRADAEESRYKYERATAYANARSSGRVKSAVDGEQLAIVESFDSEQRAIKARETSAKLSNLLNSIEQAINGIKFLGRNDGTMTLPRR